MTELNLIDQPGTAEDTWSSWPSLAALPEADISAWRSVVIVAAHPDDEVLGAGGTMALLAAAGVRLRLIALTDGEASHPGSDARAVARTRIAESAAALRVLGVHDIETIRLGLPDTGLNRLLPELTGLLRTHCRGFDACLAPWEADAHADHEAAGQAARQAFPAVWMYPVWMWHWAIPADLRVPWQRGCQIPLTVAAAAAKRAAISAFVSQLTAREPAAPPVLSGEDVAHFTRQQEVYFR